MTRKDAWKDALFAEKLSAKTVGECYFSAGRSFFNRAISNDKAQANPFAEIRGRIPKEIKLRPKSLKVALTI